MKTKKHHENVKPLALVTGATGNIGPAICEVLRREGWRVAASATSHSSFALYEKAFGRPLAADGRFVARFDGRQSCHHLAHEVIEKLGPIALLVNNATANPGHETPLGELTEEMLDTTFHLNFSSALWLTQATENSLVAQKGSVVNISSILAVKHAIGQLLYPSMKAALETLTACLALILGPKGVRVNAIRVGSVPGYSFLRKTLKHLPAEAAQALCRELVPLHHASAVNFSTVGRAGLPNDVAEMTAFLASPRAGFINGAVIPLEGGITSRWDAALENRSKWNARETVERWLKKHRLVPKR
ncbi:MAG: SDR family oxidoreductase [Verrucomicrobia bacterium]|nr:SDR family oxidoreductase [Verrucomicrobiota bacterium]